MWEGRERRKRGCRLDRRRGHRLQVKDKLRTAKEIRVVSAHICYWLEQRENMTGHGVKTRQTGGRDTGVAVKLGGRNQIRARIDLSGLRTWE